MKITKKQLNQIIKEETQAIVAEAVTEYIPGTSAYKMKKGVAKSEEEELRKYGPELAAWMKKSLKSLGDPPIDDLSQGAKSVVSMTQASADGSKPDDMQIKGGVDGDISLSNLKASQSEIGSAQSLKNTMAGVSNMDYDGIDWGDPAWLLEKMKGSATFKFKSPIVVAKTGDGFVVLDGHHRWSQATMINPNGKINAVGFNAGNMSADDVLQALHLGIYAVAGQAGTKPAKGANLLAGGEKLIRTYLNQAERKVNPETLKPDPNGVPPYVAVVMKLKGITDLKQGYSAAEARAAQAIAAMKSRIVPGAPPRTQMPQTDVKINPGATPGAVAKALKTGRVNYAPPFGGQAAATEKKPGALAETIRDIIKEILKDEHMVKKNTTQSILLEVPKK